MTISKPDLHKEAQLLTLHFQAMLVRWGQQTPPRTGIHASAVLVPDDEWCLRKHTLAELYPDTVQKEEYQPWDWKRLAIFLDGWERHRKWQKLFKDFAQVIYFNDQPELDLTHYDETRNIHFSPDAIIAFAGQQYVVEIKGLDTEKFQKLTDDLDTACGVSDVVKKARIQCNLYMHLLQISRGILLIEDKNTQEIKLWVVGYDLALSRQQIDRIYDVKRAVTLSRRNLEKLPGRICQSRDDARARQCPLRDTCFLKVKDWEEL